MWKVFAKTFYLLLRLGWKQEYLNCFFLNNVIWFLSFLLFTFVISSDFGFYYFFIPKTDHGLRIHAQNFHATLHEIFHLSVDLCDLDMIFVFNFVVFFISNFNLINQASKIKWFITENWKTIAYSVKKGKKFFWFIRKINWKPSEMFLPRHCKVFF